MRNAEGYDVRNGIIASPGKFEGEPEYLPTFWESPDQTWYDDFDDKTYYAYIVTAGDRDRYRMDDTIAFVIMEESESGFVSSRELTEAEYDVFAASFA